ncbi:DUF4129 domain-containing protein [Halorussus litoreus]|uniref:DUF4129 domain-containing protein n=1 Tax=Halorussus litoreus TaxID=1710536 RepID=UPI000E25FB4F|nr:DUF4129 domain-containing protein [Halorussus litoreus]
MQRRAALAVLCVFAVALSASLFPAGGFGTAPSGVGTGGAPAPADGGLPDSDPSGDDLPDGYATTGTADPAGTTSPSSDASDGSGSSSTETTETTTNATTTTETPIEQSGDGNGPLAVFSAVLILFGGLAAVGFRTGFLGLRSNTAGAAPATLTVNGTPVGELVGSVPARTMGLVVGLSASVPRVLDDAAALTRAFGGSLSTVLGGLARGTGDALRIGARGLGATLSAVPRAFAGLGAGAGLLSSLGNASLPSIGRRSRGSGGSQSASASDSADEPADSAPPTVEEAWQALTERVRLRNAESRTPGEFARAAMERGYPDDAVRRLTDAFREVRYGDLSRSDRTEAAREALDGLRKHWGDRK